MGAHTSVNKYQVNSIFLLFVIYIKYLLHQFD